MISLLPAIGLTATFVIALCAFALILAIAWNFMEAQRGGVRRERKSIVETGTMTLFFAFLYAAGRWHVGALPPPPPATYAIVIILGTAVIVGGTLFNIWGRLYLGRNWANQIKIYDKHTLVTSGPYAVVRHPLYASLIWMFLAASAVYWNAAMALLTAVIFIPFMWWRAKQEEDLLTRAFPEYGAYRRKTGMFFPRLLRWHP